MCSSTARSPPAPWAMPTPQPVLLARDAAAAPRRGSGRKHRIIRVEFSLGGQRNAVEVLLSGCEEGKDGELDSPLKGWRHKKCAMKTRRNGCHILLLHGRPRTALSCASHHHSTKTSKQNSIPQNSTTHTGWTDFNVGSHVLKSHLSIHLKKFLLPHWKTWEKGVKCKRMKMQRSRKMKNTLRYRKKKN